MRERITTTHNHQWLLVAANHLSPVSFLAVLKQAPKLNQGEPSIFNRVFCVCVPCVGCARERARGRDAHSRSALLVQAASCARSWCSSAMVLGKKLDNQLSPIQLSHCSASVALMKSHLGCGSTDCGQLLVAHLGRGYLLQPIGTLSCSG